MIELRWVNSSNVDEAVASMHHKINHHNAPQPAHAFVIGQGLRRFHEISGMLSQSLRHLPLRLAPVTAGFPLWRHED